MAGTMEKTFRLVLDADPKAAVSGLDKVGSAAKQAETNTTVAVKGIGTGMEHVETKMGFAEKAAGKFGISTGQMATVVGGAAVAAGGALAAFALQGAAKFGALGEDIEKFKTVAGVPADVASRWVAVADDFGISADTLGGAVGKLGKGLGGNIDLLDKFGVSVAYAKDGSVDLAATTFNVIDAYNKTVDPAKKAALGSAAFGKSYQELIPLIDEGSASIKASFDDVSKAQLFDDKKIQQAKDYRLAMDDIHDSISDVQMQLGQQLTPAIGNFADALSKANPTISTFVGWIDAVGNKVIGFDEAMVQLSPIGQIFGAANEVLPSTVALVDDATAATLLAGRAAREAAGDYGGYASGTLDLADADKQLGMSQADTTKSTKDLSKETANLIKRYQDEQSAILDVKNAMDDSIGSALDAQQATLDQATAVGEYTKSLKDSKLTAGEHKQAFLDVQNQILDTSNQLGDYAVNQAKASGAVVTAQQEAKIHTDAQIASLRQEAATLDPKSELYKSLQQWIALLESTPKTINTDFTISGNNIAGAGSRGKDPRRAAGGPVSAMTTYRVNELGEEFFTPLTAGTITPAGKWGMAGGGGSVIINNTFNVPPNFDKVAFGRLVTEAQSAYRKVNGGA